MGRLVGQSFPVSHLQIVSTNPESRQPKLVNNGVIFCKNFHFYTNQVFDRQNVGWNGNDFSSLLTVRVEPPREMESRKRKWKNEEERLAMIKELQAAKVRLNEKSKAFEMEERKKLMALDKVLQDLIAKDEKVGETKKQTVRELSTKEKVVPAVKSKGREELEKREH